MQVVLKASAGMDYWQFTQFLSLLGLSRLNHLQTLVPSGSPLWPHLLNPLHTLLHKILSGSPKNVTFLKTVADFECAMVKDGMDSVLCSLKDSREAQRKLIKLLPASLTSKLTPEDVYCNASVLFRLYELSTIETLIQNVVSVCK